MILVAMAFFEASVVSNIDEPDVLHEALFVEHLTCVSPPWYAY
jgi:hypothetical protein